jgi:hypothetical protein
MHTNVVNAIPHAKAIPGILKHPRIFFITNSPFWFGALLNAFDNHTFLETKMQASDILYNKMHLSVLEGHC